MQEATYVIIMDSEKIAISFLKLSLSMSKCSLMKLPMKYNTTNQSIGTNWKLYPTNIGAPASMNVGVNVGNIDHNTIHNNNNLMKFFFDKLLINLFKNGESSINTIYAVTNQYALWLIGNK